MKKQIDIEWFNLNPGFQGKVFGRNFKWFNCFRRKTKNGDYWGLGIIQIGSRHLVYVSHSGVSVLFINKH